MARHGFNHRRSNKLTTPKVMTLAAQMAIIHASLFQRGMAGLLKCTVYVSDTRGRRPCRETPSRPKPCTR